MTQLYRIPKSQDAGWFRTARCVAVVVWLGGCGTTQAPANDSTPVASEGEFRALSYNVWGLPQLVTGNDPSVRMTDIGPLLNGYDLVGLQEDWDDANHEILAQASGHPTEVRFDEVMDGRFYGSGLAVFADMPSVTHHHQHFTECHGVLDHASDCLASKGFQMVRLALSTTAEIDVYNSHLEAGGSDEDVAARRSHVDDLIDAMITLSNGRAMMFLGDTNLHAGDSSEAAELQRWLDEVGLSDACEATDCAEADHIDRIFFRSGGGVRLQATSWSRETQFVDAAGEALSDHPAIAADFSWAVD